MHNAVHYVVVCVFMYILGEPVQDKHSTPPHIVTPEVCIYIIHTHTHTYI